jgi:ribosomal protein S18 acetylase RimI-like enzyme
VEKSFVVRQAEPQDARAIAEVSVALRRWSYRGVLPEKVLQELSIDEFASRFGKWLAAPDPDSTVFVAERHGGIVGYAFVTPSDDEDLPPGTAEVESIYVMEDVAGTGIAQGLMDAALARARAERCSVVSLWVRAENPRARRFYEKVGFRLDGAERTRQHPTLPIDIHEVRYRLSL